MVTVVQKLSSVQHPEMLRHLKTLPDEDRRLRFGTYMGNAALEQYVNRMDFSRDKVFVICGDDMTPLGIADGAIDRSRRHAELGLSVKPAHRGKGYGLALLNPG